MGVPQLRKCDLFWEIRQRYATLYNDGFRDLPEIILPCVKEDVQHAWHLYVIQLDQERLRIGRNEFIELLRKQNIASSVHFIPLHLHPFYRDTFGYRPGHFPVASAISERIVSLPIYSRMTEADVQNVIEVVRGIICEYRR
jgi:perosamine synthetase